VAVDGVAQGVVPAAAARPDVAAAFPAAGPSHGFSASVPAGPGSHSVCVSALSTASTATASLLRCATVTG
jgi:hypothetical protein